MPEFDGFELLELRCLSNLAHLSGCDYRLQAHLPEGLALCGGNFKKISSKIAHAASQAFGAAHLKGLKEAHPALASVYSNLQALQQALVCREWKRRTPLAELMQDFKVVVGLAEAASGNVYQSLGLPPVVQKLDTRLVRAIELLSHIVHAGAHEACTHVPNLINAQMSLEEAVGAEDSNGPCDVYFAELQALVAALDPDDTDLLQGTCYTLSGLLADDSFKQLYRAANQFHDDPLKVEQVMPLAETLDAFVQVLFKRQSQALEILGGVQLRFGALQRKLDGWIPYLKGSQLPYEEPLKKVVAAKRVFYDCKVEGSLALLRRRLAQVKRIVAILTDFTTNLLHFESATYAIEQFAVDAGTASVFRSDPRLTRLDLFCHALSHAYTAARAENVQERSSVGRILELLFSALSFPISVLYKGPKPRMGDMVALLEEHGHAPEAWAGILKKLSEMNTVDSYTARLQQLWVAFCHLLRFPEMAHEYLLSTCMEEEEGKESATALYTFVLASAKLSIMTSQVSQQWKHTAQDILDFAQNHGTPELARSLSEKFGQLASVYLRYQEELRVGVDYALKAPEQQVGELTDCVLNSLEEYQRKVRHITTSVHVDCKSLAALQPEGFPEDYKLVRTPTHLMHQCIFSVMVPLLPLSRLTEEGYMDNLDEEEAASGSAVMEPLSGTPAPDFTKLMAQQACQQSEELLLDQLLEEAVADIAREETPAPLELLGRAASLLGNVEQLKALALGAQETDDVGARDKSSKEQLTTLRYYLQLLERQWKQIDDPQIFCDVVLGKAFLFLEQSAHLFWNLLPIPLSPAEPLVHRNRLQRFGGRIARHDHDIAFLLQGIEDMHRIAGEEFEALKRCEQLLPEMRHVVTRLTRYPGEAKGEIAADLIRSGELIAEIRRHEELTRAFDTPEGPLLTQKQWKELTAQAGPEKEKMARFVQDRLDAMRQEISDIIVRAEDKGVAAMRLSVAILQSILTLHPKLARVRGPKSV